jgi:hypothetical protein
VQKKGKKKVINSNVENCVGKVENYVKKVESNAHGFSTHLWKCEKILHIF